MIIATITVYLVIIILIIPITTRKMNLNTLQWVCILFIAFIVRRGCSAPHNKDATNTFPYNETKGMETYSAAEMCSSYSQLIYKQIKDSTLSDDKETIKCTNCNSNPQINISNRPLNINDQRAAPREFLHMALLGDSNGIWLYSGSLISNRWILSVAHYERIFSNLTRWARMRDPNYLSETDDATPMDYQIDQTIVHPDFRMPSLYNDIALFHLDRDVEFSEHVRPICLNADPNWQPSHSQTVMGPGWGRNQNGEPSKMKWDALHAFSSNLFKVNMDIVSTDLCESSYQISSDTLLLTRGVDEDRMMCAGVADDGDDSYVGFGGSSLQIAHSNFTFMYTQVGVLAGGNGRCAIKDLPHFYMRVSNYLPWIERIVWPKSG